MSTAEQLERSSTYFKSMAKTVEKTIAMARQDLVDAKAAAREGDKSHPLTPEQALAIKCELQREHALWVQLAEEIDNYLGRNTRAVPEDEHPPLFHDAEDDD